MDVRFVLTCKHVSATLCNVSRRIILGLPEFCLQFAEFAEPCRTPAELFRRSLMTGKNFFVLLSTRRI